MWMREFDDLEEPAKCVFLPSLSIGVLQQKVEEDWV